jgi:uncharacterized protein YkwD
MISKQWIYAGISLLMLCFTVVTITSSGCYLPHNNITETRLQSQNVDSGIEAIEQVRYQLAAQESSEITSCLADDPNPLDNITDVTAVKLVLQKELSTESTVPSETTSNLPSDQTITDRVHTEITSQPSTTAIMHETTTKRTKESTQPAETIPTTAVESSAITQTTVSATPTQSPSTTPSATPTPSLRNIPQLRQDMFDATNKVRKEHGQPPVTQGSATLQEIAMLRARELATQYSHRRPDGTYYDDLLRENDISFMCAAENIAKFSELATVTTVINAWSSSSGHLLSITRPEHDTLAIGYYECPYGRQYWVQIFTGKISW